MLGAEPTWTWDDENKTRYLDLTPGGWKAHTMNQIPISRTNGGSGWVILDLDDTGRVLGIEII